MSAFALKEFLPANAIARVTEVRIKDPDYALRAAAARTRRPVLAPDGMLNILAADHPARRVTKVGDNPLAMADRHDFLARIVRILMSEMVDGVMATMDVLEELLALDGFLREAGAPPVLDGKLLIASLNRGGLASTCWELDDPITGPTPATCAAWHFDGTKFLLRMADDDAASLATMMAAARAVTEANALGLPTFLEPLPTVKTEKGYSVVKTPEALARIVGVASALGDSSRLMWLKLPHCDSYEVVARATTLPVLLLGGETKGDPRPFLCQVKAALEAGPNVRGALVGRSVLYPGDGDPLPVAEAVGGVIHKGWSLDEAMAHLQDGSGRNANALAALA